MPKVYEVSNPSNSVEGPGLMLADEFLPLIVLDEPTLLENHTGLEEPESTDGIELAKEINNIPDDYNKVCTIVNDLDEITIPVLVKKGYDGTFYDQTGTVEIAWAEEVEGIEFEKESYDAKIGKDLDIKITKTDPRLDQEVELLFLANDKEVDYDNQGELEDVVCGRIKIHFVPKAIEYETLKIKVLDCRSNQLVTNAKVDKIVLDGAYGITTDFNAETFNKKSGEANDANLVKRSQQALDGLGFNTHTPGTAYGNNGRQAYNDYWESRFPKMVEDGLIEKVDEGNPPDEMLQFIIEEYNSNFSTDGTGFINLKIPKYLLDDETNLEIGLKDFPIVLEATTNNETDEENIISRNADTVGNGTGFEIIWGNGTDTAVTQSTEWNGNFGWHAKSGDRLSQFKVSLEISIKESDDAFTEFDADLMSRYYKDEDSPYHLVFFAMQWCQPVCDDIEDNDSGAVGAITEETYIQEANLHNLNMHIVTLVNGSGKVYGTTRHGDYRPEAIDIHTITGESNIFAVHNGIADVRNTPTSAAGRYVILAWNNNQRRIRCLHMHSISVSDNDYVKAGTILGTAGRTGNFSPLSERTAANNYEPDSPYPDHVHMDDGYQQSGSGILSHRDELDIYNRNCLPDYSYPLLFPCACDVSENIANPENCNFGNTSFVSTCWAVSELKCPHMLGNNVAARRIQAQLKFLDYYQGLIDGSFGGIPQNLATASGTRTGIYNFKQDRNLLSENQQENFELSETDIDRLNQDAVITAP